MEIEAEIQLINCKFSKGLVLNKAQAARSISFKNCDFTELDCQFLNGKDKFTLNSCRINTALNLKDINLQGDLEITDCVIKSDYPVTLQGVISQNLSVRNTRVEGKSQSFSLKSAKVQGDLEFSSVNCEPAVDLTDGTVGGNLNFGEKSTILHFTRLPNLAGGLYGKRLAVNGDLVISNWRIGTSPNSFFDMRGCQVKGGIYLHRLAIPHHALIAGARAGNGLSLKTISIAYGSNPPPDLVDDAPKERKTVLDAQHVIVAGPTTIETCAVNGNALFSMGEFRGNFQIISSRFSSQGHPLALNSARIYGGLYIAKDGLGKNFKEALRLDHATLESLSFYSDGLLEGKRFLIPGLQCGVIYDLSVSRQKNKKVNASDSDARRTLLKFSQPDLTASKDLETVFRKRGEIEDADELYIDLRIEQRAQMPLYNQAVDVVWCVAAGYGRKPTRVLFVALSFVVLGAVIFMCSEFKLREATDSKWVGKMNSFWYSVILFLPFENTQMVELYLPTGKFTRFYRSLHVVMGWVAMSLIFVIIASRLVN